MLVMLINDDPTVRATISLPQSLAERAKRHHISLSEYVQQSLPEFLRKREAEAWLERNRAGIEELNEFTRKHGVLTESLRTF